ncbi:MAG: hypothetical protein WCW44_04775 [archaeon]|jgi:chorismate mutase
MKKLNGTIDIIELRQKLDLMNEKIISGLKTRSKYSCNLKTFDETFAEKKSWILYRLKKEQDIDAEFGRFLYSDQVPFIYSKKQLAKPKIKHKVISKGVEPLKIDLSKDILEVYKKVLSELCCKGDNEQTYGETTKLDVENILEINERILGLGEQVAYFKMHQDLTLLDLSSKEKIKAKLLDPKRETEVIEKTLSLAQKYGIPNTTAVREFTKSIIDLTTSAEIEFILKAQKNGFGKALKSKTNGF